MTEQTALEAAEKIVNDLLEQREALHNRTKLLTEQRKKLAYAANVGDKSARTIVLRQKLT
jgi:hypothetical protein